MPTFVPSRATQLQVYGADSGPSYAQQHRSIMELAPETKSAALLKLQNWSGTNPPISMSAHYESLKRKYDKYKKKYQECKKEVTKKNGSKAVWPEDRRTSIFVRNCRNSYQKWKKYEALLVDFSRQYFATLIRAGIMTEELHKDLKLSMGISKGYTEADYEAEQASYQRSVDTLKTRTGVDYTKSGSIQASQKSGKPVSDLTQMEVIRQDEIQATRDRLAAAAASTPPGTLVGGDDSLIDDTYGDGGLVAPLVTVGVIALIGGGAYYWYKQKGQ